jgi:segregation and condensation protein B
MNDTTPQEKNETGDSHEPSAHAEQPVTEEALDAAARVEAVLFATEAPLPQAKIAAATELTTRQVRQAIDQLNDRYNEQNASFRIESIAGGYQMLTLPEYHDTLRRLLAAKKDTRLTQAALETLSIIAYRQPILRADIEAIRGVASGEVVRTLMERGLVKIVGRAEVLGRPMLYGTTKQFLEVFGLGCLEDLPKSDELRPTPEHASPPADTESDHAPGETDETANPPESMGEGQDEYEEQDEFDEEFGEDDDLEFDEEEEEEEEDR